MAALLLGAEEQDLQSVFQVVGNTSLKILGHRGRRETELIQMEYSR